ncbi:MAG: FGGY family carbohydrate kinase [Bacteroidales bacterium]|nr:carbohydrate kinase [Lentimicrobiaceae bacterium]MDD5694823.1 FGGY family carbohydrate kinase [Bacteroidales bacterium]
MKTLGLDIGSSFIKASIFDVESGMCMARAQTPDQEMPILAPRKGWAEQAPASWWEHAVCAIRQVVSRAGKAAHEIAAIGITYQMHGLVCLDKQRKPLRPSIIWCDSRAVETGNRMADLLGSEYCQQHLLNSPGNFTAAKLKWLMENEPALYDSVRYVMLPGDYIAYRLTGDIRTTVSGLSEGIFWDFRENRIADELLAITEIQKELLPDRVPTFGSQGTLLPAVAGELGLPKGIPVAYRAGDQPNNALSLNVLEPGEVAATAGTSGVVYAVTDQLLSDPLSRINTFAHVNHSPDQPKLGVLLCINGTGILNSWLKKNVAAGEGYDEMNRLAAGIPPGSQGLVVLPFGNGAERILQNRDIGCRFLGLNFNIHTRVHLYRAAQEGIAFAMKYGMEVMRQHAISPGVIRAGYANMFLSPLFRQILSDASETPIELYETDGSTGAAIGAAVGAGIGTPEEILARLKKKMILMPSSMKGATADAYFLWKDCLDREMATQKSSS